MSGWRLAVVATVLWLALIIGGTYMITGFKDNPRTNDFDGNAGMIAGAGMVLIPTLIIKFGKKKQPDKDV